METAKLDWEKHRSGEIASGYYWAVREGSKVVAIVGFHKSSPDEPYMFRLHHVSGLDTRTKLAIGEEALRRLRGLLPDLQIAWTHARGMNPADAENSIYTKLGFRYVEAAHYLRRGGKGARRTLVFAIDLSTIKRSVQ